MSSVAPIKLKQLIYKTAVSERGDDSLLEPFDDELDFDKFDAKSVEAEAKRSARVWMAAVKYITPAACVSLALTKTPQQTDKLLNIILEQSNGAAFTNVADAFSCGASFNQDNIFGLYRYALSTAASCTSILALLSNKVVADFSKSVASHLAEVSSGVKPLSRRRMPNETLSEIKNAEYAKKLNRYLNAVYPKSEISDHAKLSVSVVNALIKTLSTYQARMKAVPQSKRIEEALDTLVLGTIEKWLYHSENSANGNVLNGIDRNTRIMVIQNALNLVSSLANSTLDKVCDGSDAALYGFNINEKLMVENEQILASVMKKTNAYASAFARNEEMIYQAVVDANIAYDRPLSSAVTPNGWLRLFELPNSLIKFVVPEIVQDKVISHRSIASTIDSILSDALSLSEIISQQLSVDTDWAYKELTDGAIKLQGACYESDIRLRESLFSEVSACSKDLLDYANQKSFGNIIKGDGVPAINSFQSLSVRTAVSTMAMLSLFIGKKDSNVKFEAIKSLNKKCFDKACEMFILLNKGKNNIDSQIMFFGAIFNAVSGIACDALKHQYSVDMSSSKQSVIKDLTQSSDLFKRVDSIISSQCELISKTAEHGIDRIALIAIKGADAKKFNAASMTDDMKNIPAAMVL